MRLSHRVRNAADFTSLIELSASIIEFDENCADRSKQKVCPLSPAGDELGERRNNGPQSQICIPSETTGRMRQKGF